MMKKNKRIFIQIEWRNVAEIRQDGKYVVITWRWSECGSPVKFMGNARDAKEYMRWYLEDYKARLINLGKTGKKYEGFFECLHYNNI